MFKTSPGTGNNLGRCGMAFPATIKDWTLDWFIDEHSIVRRSDSASECRKHILGSTFAGL
jgi:hypothetical protein